MVTGSTILAYQTAATSLQKLSTQEWMVHLFRSFYLKFRRQGRKAFQLFVARRLYDHFLPNIVHVNQTTTPFRQVFRVLFMDALQIVLHFYQMLSSLGAINFCSPTKGLAQELLSPIIWKPCLHVPAIIAFFFYVATILH